MYSSKVVLFVFVLQVSGFELGKYTRPYFRSCTTKSCPSNVSVLELAGFRSGIPTYVARLSIFDNNGVDSDQVVGAYSAQEKKLYYTAMRKAYGQSISKGWTISISSFHEYKVELLIPVRSEFVSWVLKNNETVYGNDTHTTFSQSMGTLKRGPRTFACRAIINDELLIGTVAKFSNVCYMNHKGKIAQTNVFEVLTATLMSDWPYNNKSVTSSYCPPKGSTWNYEFCYW